MRYVAGEGSGVEAPAPTKLDCPRATGARGGGGAAREALWPPRGGEQRPAMEVIHGGGAGGE